jgi:hypothetical protein
MAGKQKEASSALRAYLRVSSSNSSLPYKDVPQVRNAIKMAKAADVLKAVVRHGLEAGASLQAKHFGVLALGRIGVLLRKERAKRLRLRKSMDELEEIRRDRYSS